MAQSSSDTAFATLEKSFTYRGAREHWTNSYHVDQVPIDGTTWKALCDAIWLYEKTFMGANVQIERYYGHSPGNPPVLVFEYDFPPTGEGGEAGAFTPIATEFQCPGDSAFWVRWGTTQKTSLGKPIYLRNYYHDVFWAGAPDTVSTRQTGAATTFIQAFQNGLPAGTQTFRRAGPRGAVAQNHAVGPYVTTRTLKSRGQRRRITQAMVKAAFDAGKAGDVPFILGPAFP